MACGVHNGSPEFCVARRILENRCRRSSCKEKRAGVLYNGISKFLTNTGRLSDYYFLGTNIQDHKDQLGRGAKGFRRFMTSDGQVRTGASEAAETAASVGNAVGIIPGVKWWGNLIGDVSALGIRLASMKFQNKATDRWLKNLQGLFDAGIDPDKPFGKYS